jgi:RNA polymerase sigma-70 factor, ECF subfamily
LEVQLTGLGLEEVPRGEPLSQEILRDMQGLQQQLARVTRDRELAADILQDAVVTALQKLRAGEISGRAELDGYVYRVALNHFRNHVRKDKSRFSDSDAQEGLADTNARGLPESLGAAQWARVAKQLLQEITPARDRELLVRFYLNEESKEQLCESFGLSDLHFNRVIFRARNRFKELLKRRGLARSDLLSIAMVLFIP